MASTTIDGVDLYHEVTGTGPCLVLTHGSWTDGSGWQPAVARLAERYRVVTWDRRGHSRSGDGPGPGSVARDAMDLVGLIEHVSDEPVHVVGSSYGGNVSLNALAARPELMRTVAVHEPPLFALLEGIENEGALAELQAADAELATVTALLRSGSHGAAAEHFMERVALGPGSWAQLPEPFRAVVVANAPTYLDELDDATALTVDTAALAATDVPVQLTHGTESPALFRVILAELAALMATARIDVIDGAGHIPHATDTDRWVAGLTRFHEGCASSPSHS